VGGFAIRRHLITFFSPEAKLPKDEREASFNQGILTLEMVS